MFSARFLRSITKYQRPEDAKHLLRLDRYWHPPVAEPLLKRIDELVALKPKQALGLAEVALELVKRIRDSPRELQAHAHCSLATAQRSTGNLFAAEGNYHTAEKLSQDGPVSLTAMIMRQKAILLLEQGNPKSALVTAKMAVEVERRSGVFPDKSLIGEGIIRAFQGDYEGSVACFFEVLQNGEPEGDTFAYAAENYVASLLRRRLLATEVVEARESLRKIQHRIRGIRSTPIRYVIWHTEGLLHVVMAEYRSAINHFVPARLGFLRLEQVADFARVTVDLIDTLVKKGDLEKAQIIIERTAKELAEFEGSAKLADVFRSSRDKPINEVAQFIRAGLLSAPQPRK